MSFIYAKLLVVICIAYVVSEVVTHSLPLVYYEVSTIYVQIPNIRNKFIATLILKISKNQKLHVVEFGWKNFFQGFFTYLYGASILFLLYVFCFLLQESACCQATEPKPKAPKKEKKEKENKKNLKKEKEEKEKEKKEREKSEKERKEKEKKDSKKAGKEKDAKAAKDKSGKDKDKGKEAPKAEEPAPPPPPPPQGQRNSRSNIFQVSEI